LIAASAKADRSLRVSGSTAQPARSRHAMRTISCRRQRRNSESASGSGIGARCAPPAEGARAAKSSGVSVRCRSPRSISAGSNLASRAQDCATKSLPANTSGTDSRTPGGADPRAAAAAAFACSASIARCSDALSSSLAVNPGRNQDAVSSRHCRRDRGKPSCRRDG
jgi:hypothetical protein